MNEMKHFFNTTSVDTIGECLNGEKLLNASRNEKGNTLLTFESAYEGYSDLLTITPDGSVIGTFICDEEQQPQTVNDTQCAAPAVSPRPPTNRKPPFPAPTGTGGKWRDNALQ